MDIKVKSEPLEPLERDIKDAIEPLSERNIKEEKELLIESDWLPTKYEDEESEYYQEFIDECYQNELTEVVVKDDSTYEQYIIENLDESDDSDGDYEDDYPESDVNDSGETENCFAEIESPNALGNEDSLASKSLYHLQLNKWILDNYINRECPVCNQKCSNYRELQRHVILNHKESIEESESNYYFSSDNCGVCKKCNQEFITQYSRYVHSKKHSELASSLYIHICKICNFNSKRVYVQNHILKKHSEVVKEFKPSGSIKNIKCPLCSTTYMKRLHLCYHFMDKHTLEYKAMLKYNCPLCSDGIFDEEELFLRHLVENHCLNSWKILNYRKIFKDKDYLACVKCNRLFFQNDTYKLLSHFLKHDTKFVWSCKFCRTVLSFKTSPVSHMCVKMMRYYETSNETAKVAQKTESKIKNLQEFEEHIAHVCPFCNKEFNKMVKWQHHMRAAHEIDTLKGLQMSVVGNDSNKLRCLICYTELANLPEQIHAHSFQHLPYKPYKCLLCLKTLNTFQLATDHVSKRCGDDDSRYDIRSILKIQCSACNFENIKDLKSVLKHYENEHSYFEDFFIKESDNSTMTCKICLKKYVQKEKKSYFLHLQNHFDEKTFKCKLCLRSYPTYKIVSEHLLQFHNAKPFNKQAIESEDGITSSLANSNAANVGEFAKYLSYVCPECNECMTTKMNWNTHIRTHHNIFAESSLYIKAADGSLKCPTCSITLSSKKFQQRKHKLTHMPHKSFMCNLCYDRSISVEGIYLHFRRKHFAQGTFQCPICSTIHHTEFQRTEHIKTIHPREEWPDCLCLICFKILANKFCLNKHMYTHKADRYRHTCEICGTKILELRDLNIHMNRHKMRGEKISDDVTLRSTFSNRPSNDTNDIDIVTQSGTDYKSKIKKWYILGEFEEFISYVCPECNVGMTTQEHWHRHIGTKHNFFDDSNLYIKEADGSLKCPTCSIAVDAAAYKQQKHKLCHMPYKSFMCNLCYDCNSSLDGLYVHFRRKHFAQGTFGCPICSEILQNEYQRTEHLKNVHPPKEWPTNMCLICYEIFTSESILNRHMIIHNNDSFRYICDICGYKVFKLRDFNAHMDMHKIKGEIKEKLSDDISLRSVSESRLSNDTEIVPVSETEHTNDGRKTHFLKEFEELTSYDIKKEFIDDISSQCSSVNGQSNDANRIEIFNESEAEFITSYENKAEKVVDISLQYGSTNSHSNDTTATEHINKEKMSNVRYEFEEFLSYACPECNEGMTTQEQWHGHIRTQHDFFDDSNLYIKEADGSLKCPTCRITVDTRPYPQQRHKLTHMPYKSFICNLCYARCNSLNGIYEHFRRKHFAEGTFECPICNAVLQNIHQRTEHIKNIHPRKEWPDIMCSICYKIYPSKSRVKHHMVTHNEDRFKYTCDVCGSMICNLRNFKIHMDKHKSRGETNVKLDDTINTQLSLRNCQSNDTGIDIVAESHHLKKRKFITKFSEIKKTKVDT